jgi:hypothetical protein
MRPSRSNRSSSDTVYQGTVIIPYVKGTRRNSEALETVSMSRHIFKAKLTLRGQGARGSVVGWGICYKLQGRGFDSRWVHLDFSIYPTFQPHYGPGVDSASNRNEYQESSWGLKGGGLAYKVDKLTAICEPIV